MQDSFHLILGNGRFHDFLIYLKKKALQTCDLFIRKIHPVVSKTPAEKGMELDGIEAVRLFKLLDADGNGAIEIDEQLYCKRF